jgi:dipeptidyl aminopeptidase/acylaminoacyl peptidase
LITGSRDGTIRVWDLSTRKQLRQFGTPEDRPFRAAVSGDGRLLATGRGDDETVHIWEVGTGKEVRQLDTKRSGVEAVAFSADGKVLATVSINGAIEVWEVGTGKRVREIGPRRRGQEDEGGSRTIALSADGQTLAALTGPNSLTLHDLSTGQQRRVELAGQRDGSLFRLFFSPNGKVLAGLENDSVILWATGNGRQFCRIEGQGMHSSEGMMVWESAVFSPDGRLLATVGRDNVINLWEASTGKPIRSFKGHQGWGTALAFTPDGRLLASGSLDTTVLLWDLTGLSPDGKLAARELAAEELKSLWEDLRGADAAKAHRAQWLLAATPKQTLSMLQEHLKAATAIDPERLARLIADLDRDQFEVRQKSFQELETLGELAAPALRKALASKPSLEVSRRLEELLQRCDETTVSEAKVRPQRAVAALEWMGTPEARKLLDELAKGAAGDRVTEDAKAALERMKKREKE